MTYRAKPSLHQLFKIELYWHTAMHIHLLLPQSCLGATKAELSSSDQNHMKAKPEIFTTLPLQKVCHLLL